MSSTPSCLDPRRAVALVALVGVSLSSVPAAFAQDVEMTPEARVRFDQGSLLYQDKKYTEALEEFFIGYLIDPQPDFLYTIGQVYRAKGDCGNAIEAYRSYLRTDPPAAKASKAKQNLERCEADPNAGPTDPEALPKAKGSLMGGGAVGKACPPGAGGPRRVKAWYQDWLADSMMVGGLLGLGVGGFLYTGARSDLSAAADPGRYPDHASFQAAVESAKGKQTAGILTATAGGALVTAALLRWMLHDEVEGGDEPAVMPSAGGGEDSAMLFIGGRF